MRVPFFRQILDGYPRPRHSTEAPERAADAMSEYETRHHVSGLKRKALVSVEYVPKKEDMAEGPFVCRLGATGGLPPPGTEFRAWRKNLPYRGHMMLLRGRTDGVDYIGANHAPLGHYPAGDACKYLLGKLVPVNRKGAEKGKGGGGGGGDDAVEYELELMPVGGSRVIDLECRCHALDYDEPEWDGAEDLNDYQVRAAHNARLLKAFASAKQQRKVAKIMAERRVDGNTIAAPDAMEATLKRATEGEMDASQLSKLAGERRNIPEHNPSATNAIDAYPFNQFPMFALLEKRTKWKEMVKAAKKPGAMKELRDGGGVDDFVLGLVPKLAEHSGGATDREENDRQKTRAKALAALDFLLVFLHSKDHISEKRERRKDVEGVDDDDAYTGNKILSWTTRKRVDPGIQRACVDASHGGAAIRRRGGRRRRARARRTQAVLAPQGDEGPALSPHHPHVAQGVQLRRGPGRVGGEDEDGREGVGAPVPRARVRGEEERGEEERRGRGDAGDAAAGRHQDATGRAPGDQTTAQGCEEEGLTRRLVVAEVLSPAL